MNDFGKRNNPAPSAAVESGNSERDNSVRPNDTSTQTTEEKRAEIRSRVIKAGTISYNDHHFTIPCMVRNISDTGARVKFDKTVIVPETFALEIELDAMEVDCEVVWRRRDEVGVKFVSEIRPTKRSRVQVVSSADPAPCHPVRRPIHS